MMTVAAMIFIAVMAEDNKHIAQREYWFDNDISTLQTLDENTTAVSISGLAQGLHSFSLRVQDTEGLWSSTMTKYFIVTADAFMENGLSVSRYLYWIDEEEVVTGTLSSASDIIAVDISSLPDGEHTLTWMVGDSKGAWSPVYTESFIYDNPLMIKTGINNADAEDSSKDVYYDLQGRRISKPLKGPYIVNGKIIIK